MITEGQVDIILAAARRMGRERDDLAALIITISEKLSRNLTLDKMTVSRIRRLAARASRKSEADEFTLN